MNKLKVLQSIGVVKRGHFLLSSGLHSDIYFEKFRLLERPSILFDYLKSDIEKIEKLNVDAVIGPQFGGAFVAFALASMLKVPAIYAEKDEGGDFYIGRDFKVDNKNLLLTDDILTTGGSIKKVLKILEGRANVVGIYVLIDRRVNKSNTFMNIPLVRGLCVDVETYEPNLCPLCKKGLPLTTKKTGIIK